ncbi:hypothetical protein, partial [Aeromonas caviae]|uniref:hypothetical protein n=1 Tax=Aeromonas caviae TaxID=648 RepID=UPI0038D01EC0
LSIITSTTRTAPWDTVHHGNFCAVGYHNPKREKVSGPMGSNPDIDSFNLHQYPNEGFGHGVVLLR